MTRVTRNTYQRQTSYPCGLQPTLGMGYGIGWMTKSALILDEMDDSGVLLENIARYVYDKNMNFVDHERGIDWRKYLWIVPEGTNILPDGSWYRIGDLSNGANQGPVLHAIELCAGMDDTKPANLKILPRVPDPLTGIEVENFFTLVPDKNNSLKRARVSYKYDKTQATFSLKSDIELPTLSVRIGPFSSQKIAAKILKGKFPKKSRQRIVASGKYQDKAAWWIWVEGMTNIKEVKINP